MKCPTEARVQQLVAGDLADASAQELESHLSDCDSCSQILDRMLENSDLFQVLRAASETGTNPPRVAIQNTPIDRGKKIWPQTSPSSIESIQARLRPPIEPSDIGTLAEYRVLGVLGAGGMGVVFHALDQRLSREVALKVMHSEIASTEPARRRFLSEAKAMASVDHDNVAAIYEVGEDNATLYFAMQLLSGESLRSRIDTGAAFGSTELLRIAREVAEGLAAVHDRGLVHRDLKPENIWLQPGNGRVKLLDFGLARPDSADSRLTQAGEFLGTPQYMSPEQARGEELDQSSDLFGLGVILYQLASGKLPYTGRNSLEITMALAEQQVMPLSELVPDLDSDFATLVMELLEKDREQRPATSHVVVERIRSIEQESNNERPAPPAVAVDPRRPPNGNNNTGGRFHWWLASAAALGMLLLLSGILFRVKTQNGFAYIELQGDAEVEKVFIDRDPVAFTVDLASGKLKFAVDPGSHQLSIQTQDGVELTTTLGSRPLEVSAGKDVTLKAWMETENDADANGELPFPTTGDRDQIERRIAEHLLSISGVEVRLTLRDDSGGYFAGVVNVDMLPQTPFHVYGVALNATSENAITRQDLAVVGWAESLENFEIYLDAPQELDADDWIRFCRSPAATSDIFQHLSVNHVESFTDDVVPHLSSLKTLRTLNLAGGELTDAGIRQLALPNLWALKLGFMPRVTMDSVGQAIQASPAIRMFVANQCDFSGASLRPLASLKLEQLGISWAGLQDHQLKDLKDIVTLKFLDLSGNAITASGLRHLKGLDVEEFVCLSQPSGEGAIGNEGCQVLSEIPSLQSVSLSKGFFTDEGIGYLAQLPDLKSLTVWTSPITNESLRLLESVPQLERVDLKLNDGISKEAVERLRLALPNCTVLSDHDEE